MFAFWAILLLVAYGCFHGGGLVTTSTGGWGQQHRLASMPFPLLKTAQDLNPDRASAFAACHGLRASTRS
jgi:hypothetical protein